MTTRADYLERKVGAGWSVVSKFTGSCLWLKNELSYDLYCCIFGEGLDEFYTLFGIKYAGLYRDQLEPVYQALAKRILSHQLGGSGWPHLVSYYQKLNKIYQAHFEITDKCNFKCYFCYNKEERAVASASVSKAEFIEWMDQLCKVGLVNLTLTGGEPLSHPDIVDLIKYSASCDLRLVINTNGSPKLSNDLIAALLLSKALVYISIYGFTEQSHQATTGHLHLEKVLSNIVKLKQAGVSVSLKFLLNKNNEFETEAFIRYCKDNQLTYMISNGLFWSGENTDLAVMIPGRDTCEHLFNDGWGYAKQLRMETGLENGCDLGKGRICLDALGNVYPCEVVRIPLGNINTNSLADIVSGQTAVIKAQSLATAVAEEGEQQCDGCGLRRYCVKCPGHSYKAGRGLHGKIDSACELAKVLKSIEENANV